MPARVLLLGGIGSGKSTAGDWFASQGAVVIRADDVARDVLAPGTDATRTVLALWPEVDQGDGTISRTALGRIVFADPAELSALESIVHPQTRLVLRDELAAHPDDVVIVEMALLRDWFDESWTRIVVDAPDDVRVARTIRREPAMSEADVRTVMARQATREQWLVAADYVLDNSGSIGDLHGDCRVVWNTLTAA